MSVSRAGRSLVVLLAVAVFASVVPLDSAVAEDEYVVLVSGVADRSGAVPLEGATVEGDDVFVFTSPDTTDIVSVSFWVDEPGMAGAPYRTEGGAPYDLAGGSVGAANPFNTETLTDGEHTVTALISGSGPAQDVVVSATFTVDNHQIVFSTSPDRTDPVRSYWQRDRRNSGNNSGEIEALYLVRAIFPELGKLVFYH